jgi:hypothetical protein
MACATDVIYDFWMVLFIAVTFPRPRIAAAAARIEIRDLKPAPAIAMRAAQFETADHIRARPAETNPEDRLGHHRSIKISVIWPELLRICHASRL